MYQTDVRTHRRQILPFPLAPTSRLRARIAGDPGAFERSPMHGRPLVSLVGAVMSEVGVVDRVMAWRVDAEGVVAMEPAGSSNVDWWGQFELPLHAAPSRYLVAAVTGGGAVAGLTLVDLRSTSGPVHFMGPIDEHSTAVSRTWLQERQALPAASHVVECSFGRDAPAALEACP